MRPLSPARLFHTRQMDTQLLVLAQVCFANYFVGLLLLLLYRFVFFGYPNNGILVRLMRSPASLPSFMAAYTVISALFNAMNTKELQEDQRALLAQTLQTVPQLKVVGLFSAEGTGGSGLCETETRKIRRAKLEIRNSKSKFRIGLNRIQEIPRAP